MSEWWTYTLSDFLMFSPQVYYRLFELHNRALWPAQLLTLGLGFAILYLLLRREDGAHRAICVMVGALWIWLAWAFFWDRYATINWAAAYVAPLIVIEGLLLIWLGAIGTQPIFTSSRKRSRPRGPRALRIRAFFLSAPCAFHGTLMVLRGILRHRA